VSRPLLNFLIQLRWRRQCQRCLDQASENTGIDWSQKRPPSTLDEEAPQNIVPERVDGISHCHSERLECHESSLSQLTGFPFQGSSKAHAHYEGSLPKDQVLVAIGRSPHRHSRQRCILRVHAARGTGRITPAFSCHKQKFTEQNEAAKAAASTASIRK
jgi:hypothetical protein